MKFKLDLGSELFRVDTCSLHNDVWDDLYKVKEVSKLKEVYHKFEFDDTEEGEVKDIPYIKIGMERSDFKYIISEHYRTCEIIIERNGNCWGRCHRCPFTEHNLTGKIKTCGWERAEKLNLAREFVELFYEEANRPFQRYEEKDRVYSCRMSGEIEYREFLKSAKRSKLVDEIHKLKQEIKYYEDRVKYYEREVEEERRRADYYRVEGQGRGKFG